MADIELEVEDAVEDRVDEEMISAEGDDTVVNEAGAPGGLENIEPEIPERTTFLDYLKSGVIELVVGSGEEQVSLHAHQGLLVQSPFFADACAQLVESVQPRRIDLLTEDAVATSSVLEWLYRRDYYPNLTSGASIEHDNSIAQPDDGGAGLLRHARVYTLAQRFGLPTLAALAHKKIHLTQSTAKGEIAYARFVYRETKPDDDNIRKPVASFWATRSHILRHEAEQEFKRMCLEFPQFGYDVLSLVLDQQEKRSQRQDVQSGPSSSGRKRQRTIL